MVKRGVILFAAAAAVIAAPAALSSGAAGRERTDSSYDVADDAALQADGKIVAVGMFGNPVAGGFALARYTRSGLLDRTFGIGGKVLTAGGGEDEADAVAVQRDGRIVVAGEGAVDGFTFVRYSRAGRLDRTFGRGGKTAVAFDDDCGGSAQDVALQSDGKIVVAGRCSGDDNEFVLARYTPHGDLDRSFGADGHVRTDFGPDVYNAAHAVAVQRDDRIVAAGQTGDGRDAHVALVRFLPDGQLDESFGKAGKVLGSPGGAWALALQPDGKIVVGGFDVARYNPDGSPDSSFGTRGTVTGVIAGGLTIQSDGKIVAASAAGPRGATDFSATRLLGDGRLDTGFGARGNVRADIGSHSVDVAGPVVLQRDGKIVVVGASWPKGGRFADFALARFTTRGSLDPGFGRGGKVLTDFGSVIRPPTAELTAAGVLVRWRTDYESGDTRGFEVYREQGGGRVRVTKKLIVGRGTPSRGVSYSYLDRRAPGSARRYWVRAVDSDGRGVFYGPAGVRG